MVKKLIFMLSLLGMVSYLFGCQSEIPTTKLPSSFVLESYRSGGRLITKQYIESDNPVYINLKNLLLREKSGWESVTVSYVPGPYIFRGGDMTIRCYKNLIVVDFSLNDEYISKQKRISEVISTIGLPAEP